MESNAKAASRSIDRTTLPSRPLNSSDFIPESPANDSRQKTSSCIMSLNLPVEFRVLFGGSAKLWS